MRHQKLKRSVSVISLASALFISQVSLAAPGDKVHAFYADEHNTTPNGATGNRILEIDLDTMSLVNTLDVPGNLGHHADNGFNSKIYGVPKGSTFVNVIELEKDVNGTTSMNITKQIDLIHKPRSGDAYNKKFNVILMAAKNRPMGSFIDVETDEIVGTIGEDVDCTLTDGTQLLSHADANTVAGAAKYQCTTGSHGGDQVSGHPYWLTSDYAAIVDRTNKQISVYHVTQVGNQLNSTLVNHLPTRTSVHQIIPRDRSSLPSAQQADFYAVEEGEHVNGNDYSVGVAHALIHMRLTTAGLQFVRRMDLQRTGTLSKTKSDRILNACINIYRSTFNQSIAIASAGNGHNPVREFRYASLFQAEGITRSTDQDLGNDFPVDCFYPGIPGGHNADFAPNNVHVYVGMAGGATSIIDVNRWKIANNVDIGIRSGPGHTCFSDKHNIAITTNHGVSFVRTIMDIDQVRPFSKYFLPLPFARQGLTSTYQSHTCYVDDAGDNYYNFFTDGGVFFKMDLAAVAANTQNGNPNMVVDSVYTGGIPIQGSYIYLKDIKDPSINQFAVNNDTAESDGNAVTIDVLSNDTGSNLTIELADAASHGTTSIVNGKIVYTPNQGYSGLDDFWYGVSSPGLGWKWANVVVTVTSTIPPVTLDAQADTASTTIGQAVTIDVLANDTGTGIFIDTLDTAWAGTVTKSNGQITYTPNPNSTFTGVDTFWYQIQDSAGETTWGLVSVNVSQGGNNVPIKANNDTATVQLGDTVVVDILANDTGNSINLFEVDTGWTGITTRVGDKVKYTSTGTYKGPVEIWYGIDDPQGNESWGLLTITIQ